MSADLQAAMKQRLDDARDELQRIRDKGVEPRNLSDPDKLRLEAAMHDMRDYERGVYARTEVQEDLRRIADYIEVAAALTPGDTKSECPCGDGR